jgi:protease IV
MPMINRIVYESDTTRWPTIDNKSLRTVGIIHNSTSKILHWVGGSMKYFISLLGTIVILSGFSFAQSGIPAFQNQSQFQIASPGALKFGLYGFDNPALLGYVKSPDLYFTWSNATGNWNDFNRWGLFYAGPGIGIGAIHDDGEFGPITDYRVSFGGGDRTFSAGLSFGWSGGQTEKYQRQSFATLGTLYRPSPYFSLGVVGVKSFKERNALATADVAVRPFGDQLFTAFFDYEILRNQMAKDGAWSAGAVVEALPGVRITGRYFDTKAFAIGFQFSLGNAGVDTRTNYDKDRKYLSNTFGIHLGAYDRNIFDTFFRSQNSYVEMTMNGPVGYQRYRFFDNTKTLTDILNSIDAAKNDPRVAGIAMNLSGMTINRELAWEIREKLKEFKAAGKHVVMYFDNGNIDTYHFASIADKIVMDPLGMFALDGYINGLTYVRGTLDKLGIGVDEWRFFKYKSAYESLSREKMSDADREQRQNLVNDYYRLAKTDICASRGFAPEQFDSMVDSVVVFTAQSAVEKGLVDTLGRWENVKDVIAQFEKGEKAYRGAGSLLDTQRPFDGRWGEPPQIALIYALGVCAMDMGITARSLVNDVNAAVENPKVKAIVLRVDSPGGDALASDIIAEAFKKAKGKKPIIVSQGYVAGSGGYWLSMYADTIVAAPTTITGSIGVAGGWLYNKSAKEWLGLSTDHVQVGAHADLGFGARMPLIGIGLPDRNLTGEERAKMEKIMKHYYKEFVAKVASGRKKSVQEIEAVAEGHFYSGYEGKDKGLVDVLGGLETAVAIAKERAGISTCEEVTIVEMPAKGLFNFDGLIQKFMPFQTDVQEDPFIEQLKFRIRHNGEVMPMMPVEMGGAD